MQYKGIIFDLDGTLFNSIDDIADAVNTNLVEAGLNPHPVENYIAWIGNGAYKLVERALPEKFHNEEQIRFYLDKFLETYNKNWNVKSKIYDGIPEVLDYLSHEGIMLSILSNKPHLLTLKIADYYFQKWNFKSVFGQREGIPKKPDPQAAIEIAGLCGMKVDEFIYVGDSKTDMKTALAAGMLPIGVTWGYGTIQSIKEAGATYIIKNPIELIQLVQSLKN